jgi:predicted amidohydrolase YtcJ
MTQRTLALASTGLAIAAFGVLAAASPKNPADLVLLSGKVFTSDPGRPWAEAVAIRGDRVVAVGKTSDIAALAGPVTRRVDLAGRVVVPGFNDAHDHLGPEPTGVKLELRGFEPTLDEVLAALVSKVKTAPAAAHIFGTIGSVVLDDARAVRETLDLAAPGRFVLLKSFTGHGWLLSSEALRAVGVPDEPEDPAGGWYERSPGSRRANGVIQEYAEFALGRRLSEAEGSAAATRAFEADGAEAARLGITSIQDMSNALPIGAAVAALREARVPVRIRLIRFEMRNPKSRSAGEGKAIAAHPSPLVTISGVKWILDGTPIERGAAMRAPYADKPATSGRMNFPAAEVRAMLEGARARDEQPMFHCSGDRSAEILLQQMEATGGAAVWAARRVRIEHGDGLMEDLIPMARTLGVVVVENPAHFSQIPKARLGPSLTPRFQPVRSLLAAGIPFAIGSDGPRSPYLNLMWAVTNINAPGEALTMEQAVTAYTRGSAYAEFAEKEKGTLAPGFLADLAVLSQDIFRVPPAALPATESLLTLVGGKVAWEKPGTLASGAGR